MKISKISGIVTTAIVISACSSQIPLPQSCSNFIDEYSTLSPTVKKLIPSSLISGGLLDNYVLGDSGTLKSHYQDAMNVAYNKIKENAGTTAADMALKGFAMSCEQGSEKIKVVSKMAKVLE